MSAEIKAKITGAEKLFEFLKPSQQRTIVMRTTNHIGKMAHTAVRKNIRDRYNIKQKDYNHRVKYKRPTAYNLSAYIEAAWPRSDRRYFTLIEMGQAKDRRPKGVTFMSIRGKTQRLKHSFIATLRSGHAGVYQRMGPDRLPIMEHKAFPSIEKMLSSKQTRTVIQKTMRENAKRVMMHQLKYLLSKGALSGATQ